MFQCKNLKIQCCSEPAVLGIPPNQLMVFGIPSSVLCGAWYQIQPLNKLPIPHPQMQFLDSIFLIGWFADGQRPEKGGSLGDCQMMV